MFKAAYTNDTKWNDTNWKGTSSSIVFNALVKQAQAELDTTKRRALYYECQNLISDDGGSIVPMFNSYVSANSKAIAHNEIAANWDSDGAKCVERWWFA
jgi:peptide/nickel transport system substrate-binding protein